MVGLFRLLSKGPVAPTGRWRLSGAGLVHRERSHCSCPGSVLQAEEGEGGHQTHQPGEMSNKHGRAPGKNPEGPRAAVQMFLASGCWGVVWDWGLTSGEDRAIAAYHSTHWVLKHREKSTRTHTHTKTTYMYINRTFLCDNVFPDG